MSPILAAADPVRELKMLVESRAFLILLDTPDEQRAEEVLAAVAAESSLPFFVWTVTRGLGPPGAEKGIYNTSEPLQVLLHVEADRNRAVYMLKDFHRYLDQPVVARKLKDIADRRVSTRGAVVLAGPDVAVPAEIQASATRFRLALPGRADLLRIVNDVCREFARDFRIRVDLEPADVEQLVSGLRGLTLGEARRVLSRAVMDDRVLSREDLRHVFDFKREVLGRQGLLEFVGEGISFSQVGGFENLKAWIAKRRGAFSEAAARFGLPPPRGVLILGVPGCGKSLASKAVASEWGVPLLRLDPSSLYTKYVGESERNLRQTLEAVDAMAPLVLWIDEIEKGFPQSDDASSDGGLSRRIFGTFLIWMQERSAPVFLVATANRVDLLPPEILRKGRFDETFFVDLPSEPDRQEILRIQIARKERDPVRFDLPALARATEGFSGAEIEQAIVAALYAAFAAGRDLSTELVLAEIASTKPLSVLRAEEVASLRAWASSRAVPV